MYPVLNLIRARQQDFACLQLGNARTRIKMMERRVMMGDIGRTMTDVKKVSAWDRRTFV
jgi:hypothetical protein